MTDEELEQELQAAAKKPRWYWIAIALVVVLALLSLAVAVGGYFSYRGNNASQDVKDQGARRDCVTAYNADFTTVIRNRDSLNTTINLELAQALLNGQQGIRATPEDVVAFSMTKTALQDAQTAVDKLPKLDDAVNNGYTLNGVHHLPCPM